MRESQKKARLEVAIQTISVLIKTDASLTRKLLFLSADMKNEAQLKQAITKSWHVPFLDQMIKNDLVKRIDDNGQISYKAVDKDKLKLIIDDYENQGTRLAKLIWSNDMSIFESEIGSK